MNIPAEEEQAQHQPTPAEQLGLVNGQFNVERSGRDEQGNKKVDVGGWEVVGIDGIFNPGTDPMTYQGNAWVNIRQIQPAAGQKHRLVKSVPLYELMQAQVPDEDSAGGTDVPAVESDQIVPTSTRLVAESSIRDVEEGEGLYTMQRAIGANALDAAELTQSLSEASESDDRSTESAPVDNAAVSGDTPVAESLFDANGQRIERTDNTVTTEAADLSTLAVAVDQPIEQPANQNLSNDAVSSQEKTAEPEPLEAVLQRRAQQEGFDAVVAAIPQMVSEGTPLRTVVNALANIDGRGGVELVQRLSSSDGSYQIFNALLDVRGTENPIYAANLLLANKIFANNSNTRQIWKEHDVRYLLPGERGQEDTLIQTTQNRQWWHSDGTPLSQAEVAELSLGEYF